MLTMKRVLSLAALGLFLACQPSYKPINVILIGIDTLRADHLSCYGYSRATSPSIDKLASEGVRFETAMSAAPWTLPSFATVFTSLYPSQHGAGSLQTRMRATFPTLALMLVKTGYSTAGIVNNATIGPEFGMDLGFESYYLAPPVRECNANRATDDALEWIDGNKEKRFFLFVHYFDPHLPYEPPDPYDSMFNPGYAGPVGKSFTPQGLGTDRDRGYHTIKALPQADWNQIVSLYDGEIAYTDAAVGRLIAGLDERGLRRNTLVVVLSDHGEEFLEHGGMDHGFTLYDEVLKVPLIFSLPGRLPEGQVVKEQVRLLDVAPTILDVLNVATDAHMEGASLKPLLLGKGAPELPSAGLLPPEVSFSESLLGGSSEMKCVRAYPWKFIYEMRTGHAWSYNLERDPQERQDLARGQSQSLGALETAFLRTVLGASETWYVEIAGGGTEHTFDLEIGPRNQINARVQVPCLLDARGGFVGKDQGATNMEPGPKISIRGLRLSSLLTLAFKIEPATAPVAFDFRIDGRSALGGTFLGKRLVEPKEMPFGQKGMPAGQQSEGEPPTRPQPPYILVWHSGSKFGADVPVTLSDDTQKRLRSLGYLQ